MFQPDPGTIVVLTKLDASYRFRQIAATPAMKETDGTKVPAIKGAIICDIIDNTTRQPYCHAEGPDEPAALRNAVLAACDAEKPMTPAQLASRSADSLRALVGAKDDQIERLRAELAASQAGGPKRITKTDGLPQQLVGAEAV